MQQSIIGKVVDNYEITGILGKGGMGVVYRAKDMTLDRDVALKMMDANFARDEDFLKRFKSEAKALAKLQSPNIVSVFALRETEIGFALVMEFVEGNTLADRIRQHGAMPLSKTLPIFRQLLAALDDAHRHNVIHRDIKPSNVMLTPEDVVKVTDFGLAKIQQVSSATVTMGTGGTLYYMSPEQVRGLANVDARGDIYSLGMTLYETVTGRVPFGNNATDFDMRQMIVDGKIPPPDRFNATLPKDVVKAIMKSIDKDPAKRFQSAAEMWDVLSKVNVAKLPKNGKSTAEMIAPAPNLKKHPSPRRPLYITIGIGVALIAAYFGIRPFVVHSTATLAVFSNPVGSKVIVNGNAAGATPLKNFSVAAGNVVVRINREGYYAKDTTLRLNDGQSLTLTVALTKLPQQQSIAEQKAAPSSDGGTNQPIDSPQKEEAKSPVVAKNEERKTVEPPKKELVSATKTRENKPVAMATLVLRAVPEGAISVDGGPKSSIGDETSTVQVGAGERTILFENPKYGSKRLPVNVKPGETRQLTCYFESYVSIGVSGDASGGTVVVDGKTTEEFAPVARLPLGVGKHRIAVTRFGFTTEEGEKEVIVVPSFEEKIVRLAFTLKKK